MKRKPFITKTGLISHSETKENNGIMETEDTEDKSYVKALEQFVDGFKKEGCLDIRLVQAFNELERSYSN